MKTINIKYNVGDVIRYKVQREEFKHLPCPCCGGPGWIPGMDKMKYECPECEGHGWIEGPARVVEEIKEGTIARVHAEYDSAVAGGKVYIYYKIPQRHNYVYQEDVIERVVSFEEQMAYTE